LPLANRKPGGSDPAAIATGMRREIWTWLPLGATGKYQWEAQWIEQTLPEGKECY